MGGGRREREASPATTYSCRRTHTEPHEITIRRSYNKESGKCHICGGEIQRMRSGSEFMMSTSRIPGFSPQTHTFLYEAHNPEGPRVVILCLGKLSSQTTEVPLLATPIRFSVATEPSPKAEDGEQNSPFSFCDLCQSDTLNRQRSVLSARETLAGLPPSKPISQTGGFQNTDGGSKSCGHKLFAGNRM